MPSMPRLEAEIEVEVPFHDVDAMAIAWHGRYLKYFELARCALLRRFDYDYPQMQESVDGWRVVECYVKYVRPARYGQRLRVEAALVEYEDRLKIAYLIRDAASSQRLTKGYTTHVAIDAKAQELQFVSPPVVLEK